MTAQVNGNPDADIWDFLPYHDAPVMDFDAAFERYGDEDA